ncbi:MAG: response regulator [Ruminococcaceae bacterium]|nr:response regulator [Oscillospiraceae bacterium]
MGREYALRDSEGVVRCRTEGFDETQISQVVPLSGGAQLCICGEAEEIRALREQLQEAKAANVAKETFLSNMSHDIRTPMNAIVGMTALAKKHIDEKNRVIDALNKIETASGHLLSLINDVLDMSRISSGRLQLAEERFSLSDLLHDTMTIVRPQAAQKGHALRLEAEDIGAESLYGDVLRLRQIYVNIISNAVKYTPAGGQIDLRVWEQLSGGRCRLCFRCSDNGIGMSEQFLERIFEPFERVNSSTITKVEGTGLGMSIVKQLVDAMGGRIGVESRSGEGTTVTITVPLAYEQQQIDTAALTDRRLLIIEADERLRSDYTRYLGEYSVDCTLVSSAAGALEALTDADFRGRAYHAAIIGREREDGQPLYDIAGYLHKSHPDLTLILVSDDNWEEIEYQAGRSGIRCFIPLPFFRKSLLNGLNRALQEVGGDEGQETWPDLTDRRILLVEDNAINMEIARELLGVTGAHIDTAENGRQAVERFCAAPEGWYDVILMDVQMPVLDGYAATREIRSCGRADGAEVPIYAMTANTFAEDIARARAAGMDGHIAKPIDMNLLMQTLRAAVR